MISAILWAYLHENLMVVTSWGMDGIILVYSGL